MIRSTGSSDENPAACGCPPPPRFRAIAETSISSWLERSEIRRVGPSSRGGSRISATISEPSTARRWSMIPSEYGSSAPTSAKSSRSRYETTSRAALEGDGTLERAREELQLGELHRLVDVLEDPVDVGARLDELGGETKAFGVVLCMERLW